MPHQDVAPGAPQPLPVCGNITAGRDGVNGVEISMAQLASSLSNSMQRTVVDQTGLDGEFDVHLEWAADQAPRLLGSGLAPAPSADASQENGPSIFTVIREQTGLALEAKKAPRDGTGHRPRGRASPN